MQLHRLRTQKRQRVAKVLVKKTMKMTGRRTQMMSKMVRQQIIKGKMKICRKSQKNRQKLRRRKAAMMGGRQTQKMIDSVVRLLVI